ncbi:hypothetical protein TREMEDRAFT_64814 [Tremella mesenterica DSM 1558]|uniref:uncharacterized protein n=1 Tax=Tremella mesenterica (strain ATCC 24925 / CBS 8224 / DSM 1558 / NBRC 9311 / NRRL Y-6157 / RJB 2259-6 / UBC 559-6) TaxID=578456 RepID=UPI0003F493EC|nr:uncharacterized protein TREMEDRAFT_64814 [Tremella mesenterica DSM 1558]EIW66955.1 hypothetical protein TREMEDRAFT_64814 [Tremella mesenterica DSM 1558]
MIFLSDMIISYTSWWVRRQKVVRFGHTRQHFRNHVFLAGHMSTEPLYTTKKRKRKLPESSSSGSSSSSSSPHVALPRPTTHRLSTDEDLYSDPQNQDTNLIESYISHLDAHINSSRLAQSALSNPYLRAHSNHIQSSLIGPTFTAWSSAEKRSFFSSLSRHSRYRPALIAEDIGKTESEVLWYLDYLSQGARRLKRLARHHEKGSLKRGRVWRSGLAPSAREIPQDEIDLEERLAEEVEGLAMEYERGEWEAQKKEDRLKEGYAVETTAKKSIKENGWNWTKLRKTELQSQLDIKWGMEDWTREMTREKLELIDGIMVPSWSTWLSQRSSRRDIALPPFSDINTKSNHSSFEKNQEQIEGPEQIDDDEIGPRKAKKDKIAHETAEIIRLNSIPKNNRTSEEKTQLHFLQNKKQNRERYRTKLLLNEGMSEEQIKNEGGADIIFALREKRPKKDYSKEIEARARSRSLGLPKPSTKPQISSEVSVDSEPRLDGAEDEVQDELKEDGDDGRSERSMLGKTDREKLSDRHAMDWIIGKGWDVFNFSRMRELLVLSDTQGISSEALNKMYLELKAFLTRLVFDTITLAESRQFSTGRIRDSSSRKSTHTLTPEDDSDSSVRFDGDNDSRDDTPRPGSRGCSDDGLITVDDIYQILSLHDSPHPSERIAKTISKCSGVDLNTKQFSWSVLPPGDLPWNMLHLYPPLAPLVPLDTSTISTTSHPIHSSTHLHDDRITHGTILGFIEEEDSPEVKEEVIKLRKLLERDVDDGMTEDEDEELDEKMERMDEAYDRLLPSVTQSTENDWTNPWAFESDAHMEIDHADSMISPSISAMTAMKRIRRMKREVGPGI